MRFFSEQDFVNYREFLVNSLNNAISTLTEKDRSIKAVLIGEFTDGISRFVTLHYYGEHSHVHHPEFDYFCSLLGDLMPMGMNMMIVEVKNNGAFTRSTEGD